MIVGYNAIIKLKNIGIKNENCKCYEKWSALNQQGQPVLAGSWDGRRPTILVIGRLAIYFYCFSFTTFDIWTKVYSTPSPFFALTYLKLIKL